MGEIKEKIRGLIATYTREVEEKFSALQARHLEAVEEFRRWLAERQCEAVNSTLELLAGQEDRESQSSASLASAIASICAKRSQAEVLSSLLEASRSFAQRAAIFLCRGNQITGWQASGFSEEFDRDHIKSLSFAINSDNLLGAAVASGSSQLGDSAALPEPLRSDRVDGKGTPLEAAALPIVVSRKIPALLYADSGTSLDHRLQFSALLALCSVAGVVLERLTMAFALTKGQPRTLVAETAARPAAEIRPIAIEKPVQAVPAQAPQTAAPAQTLPVSQPPTEDEALHSEARRFARLLVSEIKLYNEQKVAEGRRNKDIYLRLKQDIDRCRELYERRASPRVKAKVDHFHDELVRILGDNDPTALGTDYPGPRFSEA